MSVTSAFSKSHYSQSIFHQPVKTQKSSENKGSIHKRIERKLKSTYERSPLGSHNSIASVHFTPQPSTYLRSDASQPKTIPDSEYTNSRANESPQPYIPSKFKAKKYTLPTPFYVKKSEKDLTIPAPPTLGVEHKILEESKEDSVEMDMEE